MGETDKQVRVPFRCGFVSIVGRPNVGKSTLLNSLVEEKIAIVSKIPQTTRNPVRGIYNDERGQIIFIDTPGIHLGRDRLDKFMNRTAVETTVDVDVIIHLADTSRAVGEEEHRVVESLKDLPKPIILGLNKIDLKGRYLPQHIGLWEQIRGRPVTEMKDFVILPLSGKTGTNREKLLDILFEFLPVGEALYPLDSVTDVPQKMVIADIIREKLFNVMREEVPHSIAVVIEEMGPRKKKMTYIRALIMVERETQKEIVIGKGGSILKKIGSLARQELEELLERKVFLDLVVKAQKNWRDDLSVLEEMGYVS